MCADDKMNYFSIKTLNIKRVIKDYICKDLFCTLYIYFGQLEFQAEVTRRQRRNEKHRNNREKNYRKKAKVILQKPNFQYNTLCNMVVMSLTIIFGKRGVLVLYFYVHADEYIDGRF